MLFVYQSTNPCNCSSSSVTPDPGCDDVCNCLNICIPPIASNSTDAVEPCGGELIKNLPSMDVNFEDNSCACGVSDKKWFLSYYDEEVFATVTLSESGDLNATTVSTPVDVLHSNIIVKFVCGNLSAYLTLVVGIKDMCATASCGLTQVCDECTGFCVDNIDVGTE